MNQRGSGIDWFLFILLGFFWGSSYLFIKIGVDAGLTPFTLVAVRLLFGFLLLASVGLFNFGGDSGKGLVSLLSIVLMVVPLMSLVFATVHFYNSYEFIELLS